MNPLVSISYGAARGHAFTPGLRLSAGRQD
jgi:hypothetical protein